MTEISQAAFDLIVALEVTSKDYYEKHYRHPEWPGSASGVTIGIGYDLGFVSAKQFSEDWGRLLAPTAVAALSEACGIKGEDAHKVTAWLQTVDIPWDAAIKVFSERDVPRWCQTIINSLPNTDVLGPDSFGALVSLAYNRGASFGNGGDRYREMRAIRAHMLARHFDLIPDEIRAMKRLWPNVRGLRLRREREAALFEQGLSL